MINNIKEVIGLKKDKEKDKEKEVLAHRLGLRSKIIIYTLISISVTILFEMCLVINMRVISNLLNKHHTSNVISVDKNQNKINEYDNKVLIYESENKPYYKDGNIVFNIEKLLYNRVKGVKTINVAFILKIVICFLSGIAVFIYVFFKLTKRITDNAKRIDKGIDNFARGDYSELISVNGSDELANIAKNVNLLAKQFEKIIEDEHNTEVTKNELITSIAHDLRTPITSIMGYLELINTKQLDEQTKDRYLKIAYEKSLRLERLIEDLFTYTKFSLGQFTTNFAMLDLVKLIEQLVDEFYPRIMDEELDYEFYCECKSIMIEADGELLARLFANLLSNSLKYGKDGKTLRISVSKEDEYGIVKITNFGKTIPPYELDRIFDRFYRLENSRSRTTGGSGLGLSIVKQITEIHCGEISVTSGKNGTSFIVKLPLRQKEI